MRILVTGGAGFIGSHLIDRLLEQGHDIVCVDNLFTGSKDNIAHLKDNPHFVFVAHDIVEPFFWEEKIDQVYNLACPASPVQYQFNPIHTIKASTIGVINILGLARQHQARILQASTSEVYGDPEVAPQSENYRGNVNPIGPRACYDEGKRCAETLFFDYHRTHGLDIKVARIFNTYGPRMAFNDGRVVSNFIYQALQNQDITLYGDGQQTRSFCYVDDLVSGLMALMNSDTSVIGPINLGNPEERTIMSLAERILELIEASSQLITKPLPIDDPKRRCPDITQAQQVLGWNPVISLDDGLQKTIADFRHRLQKIKVMKSKICVVSIDVEEDLQNDVSIDRFFGVHQMRALLPLFTQFQVSSTLFCTGNTIVHNLEILREFQKAKHEMALHGFFEHTNLQLQDEQKRKDLLQKHQSVFHDAFGVVPRGFRAVQNTLDQSALSLLVASGLQYDSSLISRYPVGKKYIGFSEPAPRFPYFPAEKNFHQSAEDGSFLEIPLSPAALGFQIQGKWIQSLGVPFYKFLLSVYPIDFLGLSFHSWDLCVGDTKEFNQSFLIDLQKMFSFLQSQGYLFLNAQQIYERFQQNQL